MSAERIAKLQRFLEQDPSDSFTRYAIALEHAGMGNTTEAVAMLEDLIARDPSYVPSYHQLGYACEKLGDTERARTAFLRGIAVAREQGDHHAAGEMQEALDGLSS
jgi:predicted Zn-dependent protease